MEEDIKILEIVVNCRKFDGIYSTNEVIFKAIENLINRNKELEEYYEEQNEVNAKFIPKSKIKEKIEELDKEEQKLQNSISDEEREEYSDASISWDLCDIETRRRVLQELLED